MARLAEWYPFPALPLARPWTVQGSGGTGSAGPLAADPSGGSER